MEALIGGRWLSEAQSKSTSEIATQWVACPNDYVNKLAKVTDAIPEARTMVRFYRPERFRRKILSMSPWP